MMRSVLLLMSAAIFVAGCSKVDELKSPPNLHPLEDGFKTSSAIAYCISVASRALTGQALPPNVTFSSRSADGYSKAGIIHIDVNQSSPVPFNQHIGDITIAGIWDQNSGGVISIIFSDFNLTSADFRFYGIHTIPITIRPTSNEIVSVFAQQDIIIGNGSDTLLNLSLSRAKFTSELERLNAPAPSDAFVAVKQNVWHITAFPNSSPTNFLDDDFRITGGGQIAEARDDSGGIIYHALINTRFNFSSCTRNPQSGTAFIQNFKAGTTLDFGTLLMEFSAVCNGESKVKLATGKYAAANGKMMQLNWQ